MKQICNQQRDNRPAICYHAVNTQADADTADVLQGIARHIEYQSRADLAYDTGFEHAVQGGIGFMRLMTEYKPGSFDQQIKIQAVPNPFMVYIDPAFREEIRKAFIEVTDPAALQVFNAEAFIASTDSDVDRVRTWIEAIRKESPEAVPAP